MVTVLMVTVLMVTVLMVTVLLVTVLLVTTLALTVQEGVPGFWQVLSHFRPTVSGLVVREPQRPVVAGHAQRVQFAAQVLEVERFHLDQDSQDTHRLERIALQLLEGALVQGFDQALIPDLVLAVEVNPIQVRAAPQAGVFALKEGFGIAAH
jgi:hypothetical protein